MRKVTGTGSQCTGPTGQPTPFGCTQGEAVFDSLSASVVSRFGNEGLKGAVFIDPYATRPYVFHMALVSVEHDARESCSPGSSPSY